MADKKKSSKEEVINELELPKERYISPEKTANY